jgi:hypothetical protein
MRQERPEKIRLDRLLVERGLADTRAKAQAMILAGQVLVEEQKVEKCGVLTSARAELRLVGETLKYVSRGGLRLEGALRREIDVMLVWRQDRSGRAVSFFRHGLDHAGGNGCRRPELLGGFAPRGGMRNER